MFSYIRQNCADEDKLIHCQSTSLGSALLKNAYDYFTQSILNYGYEYQANKEKSCS